VRLKWRGKTVAVRTGEINKRKNNDSRAACVSPDADQSTLEAASFHATKEFAVPKYICFGAFSFLWYACLQLIYCSGAHKKVCLYRRGFR
jgi:hypothetical protein